jgi:hypothetical protein
MRNLSIPSRGTPVSSILQIFTLRNEGAENERLWNDTFGVRKV